MRHVIAVLFSFVVLAASARGQSSNGYVFLAPGGVSCCGSTSSSLHFGAGGEAMLGFGIGLGAEIGALGETHYFSNTVVGVLSPNGYYHFSRGRHLHFDPFVTGGYTLMFRNGHINLFNFGGGFNYWFGGGLGARLEFRDHVYSPGPTIHYWGVRFGLAFR